MFFIKKRRYERVYIEVGGYNVEWLRRPHQRSIKLQVRANGTILVSSGRSRTPAEIKKFIAAHLDWLERSLQKMRAIQRAHPPKRYQENELFPFLGKPRRLKFLNAPTLRKPRVRIEREVMCLEAPQSCWSGAEGQARKAVRGYYAERAKDYIPRRVEFFAELMGLKPRGVSLRCQKTRWGSCSSKGQLNFNWRLMAMPAEVIDYVVVHELAHLQHPNHSAPFWTLVEAFCQDYKSHRAWLRTHGLITDFLMEQSELHMTSG